MTKTESVFATTPGMPMHSCSRSLSDAGFPSRSARAGLCLLVALLLPGCRHFGSYDDSDAPPPPVAQHKWERGTAAPNEGRMPPPTAPAKAAPAIETELLKKPGPPNCKHTQPQSVQTAASPQVLADPKLLEIVRLEFERDCYRKAEVAVRRRLERLQQALRPAK